jgi:hypothetical protein
MGGPISDLNEEVMSTRHFSRVSLAVLVASLWCAGCDNALDPGATESVNSANSHGVANPPRALGPSLIAARDPASSEGSPYVASVVGVPRSGPLSHATASTHAASVTGAVPPQSVAMPLTLTPPQRSPPTGSAALSDDSLVDGGVLGPPRPEPPSDGGAAASADGTLPGLPQPAPQTNRDD